MLPVLITVAVFLILTVVLPVLSFGRASAELDGVKRLERRRTFTARRARTKRSQV